jgi:uncharacterized membrane protein
VRRPTQALLVALSLAGLAISAYLTSVHYESVPLACTTSGTVDCTKVLHSSYAEVAGIPVSVFGLVWFAVMAGLALRPASTAMLVWVGVGVLTVLWLVFVELFRVDAICLWCTAAHACVLAILAVVLVEASTPSTA